MFLLLVWKSQTFLLLLLLYSKVELELDNDKEVFICFAAQRKSAEYLNVKNIHNIKSNKAFSIVIERSLLTFDCVMYNGLFSINQLTLSWQPGVVSEPS